MPTVWRVAVKNPQGSCIAHLDVHCLNPHASCRERNAPMFSVNSHVLWCSARFEGQLEVGNIVANSNAQLALTFGGGGSSLLADIVSLFPEENVAKGVSEGGLNPWPFRADLLQMLKCLRPR